MTKRNKKKTRRRKTPHPPEIRQKNPGKIVTRRIRLPAKVGVTTAVIVIIGIILLSVFYTRAPDQKAVAEPVRLTAEGLEREIFELGQKLVRQFPNDTDPLGLMGMAYANIGQHVKAIMWYQRSLALNPNLAQAHYMIGESGIRCGEFELAAEQFRKALAVDPGMARANGRLGQALLELGRPEEAVAALETEVTNHPGDAWFEFPLGQAYLQLQQYDKAIPHLRQTTLRIPEFPLPFYALARAYTRLGDREKATRFSEEFKKLRDAEAKERREARKRDADLTSMSRIAAVVHIGAGQIYYRKGHRRKAEEHWLRAAFLDKDNSRCRQLLYKLRRQRPLQPAPGKR